MYFAQPKLAKFQEHNTPDADISIMQCKILHQAVEIVVSIQECIIANCGEVRDPIGCNSRSIEAIVFQTFLGEGSTKILLSV